MIPKVLIVGGGLTGLTTAFRLAQSGRAAPTVIERSPTLGGLAGGFSLGGHALEKAYHHLFRTDRDILNLVDELGLGSDLEWLESSLSLYFGNQFHPFSSAGDLLRFAPLPFLDRIRVGMTVYFLQHYRKGTSLSAVSARTWMRRWCGAAAMKVIWEPLLQGKFARHADEISMAWLWARIHIRANSRERQGPERLGYFRKGFEPIVASLAQRIEAAGFPVHTQTELSALEFQQGLWTAALPAGRQPFSAVVFTGSCPAFLRFADRLGLELDAEIRRKFARVRFLGAACLVFTYPESLTEAYWNNINQAGSPFLVLINHTRLVPRERYGGKHVYYLGAYLDQTDPLFTIDEATLRQLWWNGLKALCPQFDETQVDESQVFRFTDAQHVVDLAFKENLPPSQIGTQGLFVSNFAQIFPEDRGTNYAVREGNATAERVLSFLEEAR